MPTSDESVSIVEIYTDPYAVVELETRGPAGPPGMAGPSGPVGPTGPSGPTGPRAMEFQETWNPDTRYDDNDYVSWRGYLYLTNGRAEVGVEPSSDGGSTVSSGWYLMAREGIQGSSGPAGETGATGPSGPRGPIGPPGDGTGTNNQIYAGPVPAGINPVVFHGLGSEFVQVEIKDPIDDERVIADVSIVDGDSILIKIEDEEINPEDGTYTVTVLTGYRIV